MRHFQTRNHTWSELLRPFPYLPGILLAILALILMSLAQALFFPIHQRSDSTCEAIRILSTNSCPVPSANFCALKLTSSISHSIWSDDDSHATVDVSSKVHASSFNSAPCPNADSNANSDYDSILTGFIDHRWPFFLALGTTLDAFAYVFFTPVETMRKWHNTVVCCCCCFSVSLVCLRSLSGLAMRYLWFGCNRFFEIRDSNEGPTYSIRFVLFLFSYSISSLIS
jgi:hypothetical protein